MKMFDFSRVNVASIALAALLLGAQAMPLAYIQPSKGFLVANVTNAAMFNNANMLKCGATTQVLSDTNKYDRCPTDCPFFAQNLEDSKVCTFSCVPAEDCKKWNPNKPIADTIKKSRTCRGPVSAFCSEFAMDGTDTCVKCKYGWSLHIVNGQCYFSYWKTVFVVTALIVILVIIATVWLLDLCLRESSNTAELQRALDFRSRAKIMQPKNVDGHRHTFPLRTNLCTTDVAGLGMLLHFNFQAFMIIWPFVIAMMWTVLACFHEELWVLGTKRFGTPRHNCILVAWGYETQQRLMWTKVVFLAMVYLFSFITFLLFSVRQYRIYQEMDAKEITMKDFALELRGLPSLPGSSTVENALKEAVERATGQPGSVAGVSVAWNYGDREEMIMKAVRKDQFERSLFLSPRQFQLPTHPTEVGPVRKWMYEKELDILVPDEEEDLDDDQLRLKLTTMVSSDTAFVVFNCTGDVRKALNMAEQKGVKFGDTTLKLATVDVDPPVVNWQNFGDSGQGAMAVRFWKCFFTIYVPALAIWFFVFYAPYAWSVYTYNYDNGAELPGYYALIFTMIVVGGNATMYAVCDQCCERIGFRYKDSKQCAYTLMYLFACAFNVLLDMVVTYYTALKIMIGLGFRTYDGTKLEHIDTYTDQFETYAMQRTLGGNTYAYAFPSTFLIPFLIEPFVTVLVPYHLGKLIIRTHTEIKGTDAEAYIAALEFDLGRYADILLNVFLGILIFYFPGGYTWTLFYGMFISHIVIYLFDHWRVINVIPNIKITSYSVDWYAQAVLAACCGLILSSLVFKANCAKGLESITGYCIHDGKLVIASTLAGVGHFVVHMILLIYIVPRLGAVSSEEENTITEGFSSYKSIAENDPYTWFSVNPVHCLRSKYIHKHSPYCRWASAGKEHLLEANDAIGCHFHDTKADNEDYSVASVTGVWKAMHRTLTKTVAGK
jgi:hypothetical protein